MHLLFESGGDQPGQSAYMVDMHVGGDERTDRIQGKLDGQGVYTGASGRGFCPLKQAAVNQQAIVFG